MEIDSLPNGTAASPGPTLGPGPTAATPPPSSKLSHLADSLKLEHQFLRVPFEHYKKTIRANHRVVEKEISSVINGVSEAADRDNMSSDDAVNHLSSLVSRLQGLKRKLEEGSKTEHLQAQRCRARLDHLESADVESLSEWSNTRVNRILVDYMLRMSYYDTAVKLAESRNIQDFVDIDIFQEAKKVIEALQNKEVGPALAWCAENKSRLKKSKSKFEFQLRLQEFIELVRAENNFRAITYAQNYLAPWGTTHMKEFQRVFVTVAYKSTTECATYKVLFEPKQWDYLVDQFKQEFCKLYGMTLEPLLNIFQVLFEYFILVELGTIQWRQFDRFCIRTLLGGKYMKKSESLQSQPSSTSSNVAMTEDDLIDEWMHFVEDSDEKVVGDEVDSYLFDPLVQITKEESTKYFNILLWWKVNGNKYPILAAIAKDILAIQVSTVASESAFSTGGRVISDFRSSLTPKSVEALICMQNWLRGDNIITLEDDAPSIDHIEFYESIESELAKSTSSIASLTLDQEPQQAPKQSQGSNSQEPPLMRLQSARSSQAQRPPKPSKNKCPKGKGKVNV